MFTSLEQYLGVSASPEQASMILNACRVLVDAGYVDHASVLEQELEIADNIQDDLVYGMIRGYLVPLYATQLRGFGIQVNPDATLEQLTSLLEALLCVDNWADPESLYDATLTDADPEDQLAEVLSIVGGQPPENYLMMLDHVSVDLIERIANINAEASLNQEGGGYRDDVAIAALNRAVRRFNGIRQHIPAEHSSLALKAVEGYVKLGGQPGPLMQGHFDPISKLPTPSETALQIYSLLAITSIPHDEIVEYTMNLAEQLDIDLVGLSAFRPRLTEIHNKVIGVDAHD